MRLLLAAMMALTLSVVTTADRVACPDGCTDEAGHETSTTTPSTCSLCHGWNGSGPADVSVPLSSAVTGPVPVDVPEQSPHLAPIDHPPRLA